MAALSWNYPHDEMIALRREQDAAAAAAPIASGLAVEQLNFNYAISGDKTAWRPARAFDDGRQTFIEFPPSIAVGEAPPLFVIGDDGEAQLVNYRMAGRYYVVDRLFGAAELRLGRSEEHTSELQSLMRISYAVFCLKKKKQCKDKQKQTSIKERISNKVTLNTD